MTLGELLRQGSVPDGRPASHNGDTANTAGAIGMKNGKPVGRSFIQPSGHRFQSHNAFPEYRPPALHSRTPTFAVIQAPNLSTILEERRSSVTSSENSLGRVDASDDSVETTSIPSSAISTPPMLEKAAAYVSIISLKRLELAFANFFFQCHSI